MFHGNTCTSTMHIASQKHPQLLLHWTLPSATLTDQRPLCISSMCFLGTRLRYLIDHSCLSLPAAVIWFFTQIYLEYSHEALLIVHLIIVVFKSSNTLIKYCWTGCWYLVFVFSKPSRSLFSFELQYKQRLFVALFGYRGLIPLLKSHTRGTNVPRYVFMYVSQSVIPPCQLCIDVTRGVQMMQGIIQSIFSFELKTMFFCGNIWT